MKEFYHKEYSVFIGNDVFDILLQKLIEGDYSQVFVLVDEQTERYCLPQLAKYLLAHQVIKIRSGEQYKTLETSEYIWHQLLLKNADRKSVVINLGGGMVSDIGGFCAATYKRGIDFIHVPTTLLSMVDASIGGKTGVDHKSLKNMLGVFKHPKFIFIFPEFLASLPKSEVMNGYAEMIKHGLISDKEYWQKLQKAPIEEWPNMMSLIHTSVKIKMQIVKKDPLEKAERKLLNFGHTIGHAVETYSLLHDKQPLKHGEAVAIGMICEAYLSKLVLDFSSKDLRQITELLSRVYPKYSFNHIIIPDLIQIMRQDKKNSHDQFNFVLLKKLGKASYDIPCSESQIVAALNFYEKL
jgi:3-dehydroquinate synthase